MRLAPLLLCAAGLAPAQSAHNALTPQEKAAGWRLLFDGRSLAGWDDPARKSPPGDAWTVADGCIRSRPDPRIREDLLTRESFGDFELAFDWRISPRGNSGVKYRIQDIIFLPEGEGDRRPFETRVNEEMRLRRNTRDHLDPARKYQGYPIAFEYQMIDNQGHPDAAHGADRSTGALYSMLAPLRPASKPVGEFNQSRIVLRGNHVEHWLNGVKVLDADLTNPAIPEGLARRWTAASPVYQLLTRQPKQRTPIALQHHESEVWFRDLKIRALE